MKNQAAQNPAGGASEPAAPSVPRAAAELSAGANQAAQNLAQLLEDHLQLPERRRAPGGRLYTKEESLEFYGEDGPSRWTQAEQAEEYK